MRFLNSNHFAMIKNVTAIQHNRFRSTYAKPTHLTCIAGELRNYQIWASFRNVPIRLNFNRSIQYYTHNTDKGIRPHVVARYRPVSLCTFQNLVIFTKLTIFDYPESESEELPNRRLVFSQTAILFFTNCATNFIIVERHGWITTHDYVTQKDQFLLTSLPF